jgi:hypothetical protein
MFDAGGEGTFWSGHLVVVDPTSPATPVAIEAAGHWQLLTEIREGTLDAAAGSVRDLHTRFIVYLKDRRVYRLDLKRGTWPPTPTIVSSLMTTQICSIGSARVIRDHEASERSMLVFWAAGPDQACGTENAGQLAVRLDMTESDPPFVVDSAVIGALRSTGGAISGFVVRSGRQIRRVDAEFANPVDLFMLSGGSFFSAFAVTKDNDFPGSPKGRLLHVDGSQLRAYDLDSGGGPVSLLALRPYEVLSSVPPISDADGVYLFLWVGGSHPHRLIRISNTNAVQELAVDNGGLIGNVQATPTRIVYLSGPNFGPATSTEARSVSKAGGTPVTIIPLSSCRYLYFTRIFVAGENVWYYCGAIGNDWDYSLAKPAADYSLNPRVGVVRSDGTEPHEFPNSWLAGVTHVEPMPLTPEASTVHAITVGHYERATATQSRSTTLRSYDGATRTELFTYGSLPGNLLPDYLDPFESFTWTRPALVPAGDWATGGVIGSKRDIYFLQTDSAGLTRVTDFVH